MNERLLPLPYLPENNVSHILCGQTSFPLGEILKRYSISLTKIDKNSKILNVVSTHVDCAVCPVSSNTFFVENGQADLQKFLKKNGIEVLELKEKILSGYPKEAGMNAVVLGNYFICNPKTCDKNILEYTKQAGYTFISSKQGYTKCSLLPVCSQAIITDDSSIAKNAAQFLDVLWIEKGDIQLSGFPYGFIGGTGTLISKDCMLFLGDLSFHRDKAKIKSFLRNYNIYPEYAFHKPLQDIGGMIPILEWRY